ncbi:MAG: histidinol-phosphatase [Desulforegulaceae bacterium]|nr:histidinol-phosphatase [Desulforegulaceae bacterium]
MLLSLHGGHSKDFCNHASGNLEAMIEKYVELGFTHVGVSEHIPPYTKDLMFDDEKEAGLCPEIMFSRFEAYILKIEQLKIKYKNKLKIFKGFEAESYSGYKRYIPALVKRFKPDYIIGSVHHLNDICFDLSPEAYSKTIDSCGTIIDFYNQYFDLQYEMLLNIRPQIAGHFDLVRIFDEDYEKNMKRDSVRKKISRNLKLVKDYDIIIDYNQRALKKKMKEPYPCRFILEEAIDLGIKIVPGDDSHSNADVGFKIKEATDYLVNQGVEFSDRLFLNFY